jgi:Mn-containing catalase
MYHHVKKLMYTVRVGTPDPTFGNMLLEQFGGANGELAAAMQYSIQGLNCDDLERKDLLMDIGTEELSHLEIVGALARLHLKPMKFNREDAEADPLIAIAGGGGVSLYNSMGHAWTADYLKITGELDVDLRSNIAAEARAKIVYERLMNFTDDAGTKDALQFLMTREITHMKAFTAALESMGKPRFSIGKIPPTAILVDQFFNDSTGDGEDGEFDARGPWNEGDQWVIVEAPAFQHVGKERKDAVSIDGRSTSTAAEPEMIQDLLVEDTAGPSTCRRATGEGAAEDGQSGQVRPVTYRVRKTPRVNAGTGGPVEAGVRTSRGRRTAETVQGLAGLLEEGNEVIKDGEEKNDIAADLGVIASAQKVEHYEISGYGTSRALAGQIGRPDVAQLIAKSLSEEENADNLLTQIARELMGQTRTGSSKAPKLAAVREDGSKRTRPTG